jgi:hypothetical protein
MNSSNQTPGNGDGQRNQKSLETHGYNGDDTQSAMQQIAQAENMADQLESKLDAFLGDLEKFLSMLEPTNQTSQVKTSTERSATDNTQ